MAAEADTVLFERGLRVFGMGLHPIGRMGHGKAVTGTAIVGLMAARAGLRICFGLRRMALGQPAGGMRQLQAVAGVAERGAVAHFALFLAGYGGLAVARQPGFDGLVRGGRKTAVAGLAVIRGMAFLTGLAGFHRRRVMLSDPIRWMGHFQAMTGTAVGFCMAYFAISHIHLRLQTMGFYPGAIMRCGNHALVTGLAKGRGMADGTLHAARSYRKFMILQPG